MTRITSGQIHTEENRGAISLQVAGVEKLNINRSGITWGTAALAASGAASLFTAGTGTTAVSGSSWDGIGSGTKYTVGDIVTALKAVGILGA